jgi:vacuolar-type H+-ATPase subunit E/Vma4
MAGGREWHNLASSRHTRTPLDALSVVSVHLVGLSPHLDLYRNAALVSPTPPHGTLVCRHLSIRAKAAAEQLSSKMKSREELLDELVKNVVGKLCAQASKEKEYTAYLVKLIVQACIKLQETDVTIQCRQVDVKVVTAALPLAKAEFKSYMTKNASVVPELKLTIDNAHFLPPPPPQVGVSCAGGIVASANAGRIKCDNTFDTRMEQAFDALKPVVRHNLFPSQVATEIIHGSAMGAVHH